MLKLLNVSRLLSRFFMYDSTLALYPAMAFASVGKTKTKTIDRTIKTIASLECSPRLCVKSLMRRGIPSSKDSFCRKIIRYVLRVIGATSMEVVTYFTKTLNEMKAMRACPPRPMHYRSISTSLMAHSTGRISIPTYDMPYYIDSFRLGESQCAESQSNLKKT